MDGLDKFREAFAEYSDNYVVIGGAACDITMTNTVVRPRATHDIDMIVIVENMTEAFANRFLTLFPAYKDAYKDCVAQYSGFLPEYFFSTYAAPHLANLIKNGETKQFIKMVNMLDDFYVDGDNEVQSTITYSILGEMFRADATTVNSFVDLCKANQVGSHLITPAECMYKYVIKKNK